MEELEKADKKIEKVMELIGGLNVYDLAYHRNKSEVLQTQKQLQEAYDILFKLRKHIDYLRRNKNE